MSNKTTLQLVVEDMVKVFPVRGFLEEMALAELNTRINKLTELQCSVAVEAIRRRLLPFAQASVPVTTAQFNAAALVSAAGNTGRNDPS